MDDNDAYSNFDRIMLAYYASVMNTASFLEQNKVIMTEFNLVALIYETIRLSLFCLNNCPIIRR